MTTISLTDRISDTEYLITNLPENHETYCPVMDFHHISLLLSELSQCIFNNHELRSAAWDLLYIHDIYRHTDQQLIERYAHDISIGNLHILRA